MAVVTMNVRTYGFVAFPTDERLVVRFVPSGASVGVVNAYPAREVKVIVPSDGNLEVNLTPTEGLSPRVWYTIRFEWFDKHPLMGDWNLAGWSELKGRLHVPSEGGDVGDLLGDYTAGEPQLFLGHGPPPEWLPTPGVYYDLSAPEGPDVYSDGVSV